MIIAYSPDNHYKPEHVDETKLSLLATATWIDMLCPSKEEEAWVENTLALFIPTLEEMREIETSSRLYTAHNNFYMTAVMVAQSTSLIPEYDAVTFVLTEKKLITIRYIEPRAFQLFIDILAKRQVIPDTSINLFLTLLEYTVDRLADVLEVIGKQLDDYSNSLFVAEGKPQEKLDYKALMQLIGTKSNLNTKARESLITFSRVLAFFSSSADERIDKNALMHVSTLNKDLASLSDYANFISNKINFLLDATLGMVSIEQSAIIKIFSVAAVIFLPPTLIASIYGMNFTNMPELSFRWGYQLAIVLMMLSAWLPYKFFKYKKWL